MTYSEPLELEEAVQAIEEENGKDISVLDLEDRMELADYMVFTTATSAAHMRNMADMLVVALRYQPSYQKFALICCMLLQGQEPK